MEVAAMNPFRRSRRETELERRLQAERPEAPESLVRTVVDRSRRPGDRRLTPRLALVGALSAVMLAALGAFGAAGQARTAMGSFGESIRDAAFLSGSKNTTAASTATGGSRGMSDDTRDADDDGNGPAHASPWQDQYHHTWAVCHKGRQTLYLPLPGYTAHLLHGDQPGECT
jgi:hypothetical protein